MASRRFTLDQALTTTATGTDSRALQPARAVIRLDASWAPYVQGTLYAAPPSAADLTAIEPRTGRRLQFRTRSFNADTDAQLVSWSFALGIRTRTRTFTGRGGTPQLALDFAGDEALLQDYPFDYSTGSGGVTKTATAWAQDALNLVNRTLVVDGGAPNPNFGSANTGWDQGSPVWDYVSSLAEAAGARIFMDEAGVLRWVSPTWSADTVTRSIDLVSTVDDVVSRDDPAWANFASVQYRNGVVQSDSGQSPRKGIMVTRARNIPDGSTAAVKIRQTAQKRGRTLRVRAVADLSIRPQQTRTVAYQGQSWTGTVQSVSFEVPTGTMDLALNVIE